MSKEEYLEELFTKLFKLLDMRYEDFNTLYPAGDKKEELRKLEKEYPELGLARYDTENEGVSVISLLATVTDIFCGKRFAVRFDNNSTDRKIVGCVLLDKGSKAS